MTRKKARVFELTIASQLEELDAVHALVERVARESGLDGELAHWIHLSVMESAINAIQHGNGSNPEKNVHFRITMNGETIEMIVEDQGCGFNLEGIADPTDAENLLKPRGRGILIIRSFMDEIGLTRLENGGCQFRMVKKLGGHKHA